MTKRSSRPDALEFVVRFCCGFAFFGFLGFVLFRHTEASLTAFMIGGTVGGVLACFFGDRFWISTPETLRHWWRF